MYANNYRLVAALAPISHLIPELAKLFAKSPPPKTNYTLYN